MSKVLTHVGNHGLKFKSRSTFPRRVRSLSIGGESYNRVGRYSVALYRDRATNHLECVVAQAYDDDLLESLRVRKDVLEASKRDRLTQLDRIELHLSKGHTLYYQVKLAIQAERRFHETFAGL
jgi:hypothetical protein